MDTSLRALLEFRTTPGAGIYFLLTRRCPLECKHCYTQSGPDKREELDANQLLGFLDSMLGNNAPKWVMLSGGEPLLRPALVRDIAISAKAAGARTFVNTGLFFASRREVPAAILVALEQIDHLCVSLDSFHDEFVGFDDVSQFFEWYLRSFGSEKGLSVQLATGLGQSTYSANARRLMGERFGEQVELAITEIKPVGRAYGLNHESAGTGVEVGGCSLLSWPQVTYDGLIFACCSNLALKAAPLRHLAIGHIADTPWRYVHDQITRRQSYRIIRTLGPAWLLERSNRCGGRSFASTCDACKALPPNIEDIATTDLGIESIIMPYLDTLVDVPSHTALAANLRQVT